MVSPVALSTNSYPSCFEVCFRLSSRKGIGEEEVVILPKRLWRRDLLTGAGTASVGAIGGGTGISETAEAAGVMGAVSAGVDISNCLAGPPAGGVAGGMAEMPIGLILIGVAGADGAGMDGAAGAGEGVLIVAAGSAGAETGGMASPAAAETGPAAGICLGISNFLDGGRGSRFFRPITSLCLGLMVRIFGSHMYLNAANIKIGIGRPFTFIKARTREVPTRKDETINQNQVVRTVKSIKERATATPT